MAVQSCWLIWKKGTSIQECPHHAHALTCTRRLMWEKNYLLLIGRDVVVNMLGLWHSVWLVRRCHINLALVTIVVDGNCPLQQKVHWGSSLHSKKLYDFRDTNLLTGRGQSLLLLFEVLIVFLAAVVPKVTKDFYCSQPILFAGESTQHFCPGIQNGIYFLQCKVHTS